MGKFKTPASKPRPMTTHLTPGRTWMIVALCGGLLLAAAPLATAGQQSDTVNIDPGEHAAIGIDFTSGPASKVSYDVQVEEGPNIDVLVMDNANYQKYQQGDSFSYAEGWSDLDTGNSQMTFTLQEHGTWWIVLDHTGEPDGGTAPATLGAESVTARYTIEDKVDAKETAEDVANKLPAPTVAWVLLALAGLAVLARRR